MASWHLITCEFPPMVGGVSEHSRVLAERAIAHGLDVHVWAPTGAGPMPGVHVHPTLGSFGSADLAETGRQLDAHPAPRRVLLQWVPHGYGRRGLNRDFSRWIARRAACGDRLDVMVHEPFVEFLGGSWIQPLRAVVQRLMARDVLRGAQRIWLSIPGWSVRLASPWIGLPARPRVLPVPGTIPVVHEPDAVCGLRMALLRGRRSLVGYFGAGGPYAERALAAAARDLLASGGPAIVLIGRGTEPVAARVRQEIGASEAVLHATGELDLHDLSLHLQACDVMLQPYVDGVSGRRTTTVSALEHGVPVATTSGLLTEAFWSGAPGVELAPVAEPAALSTCIRRFLDPARNAAARAGARRLYEERFDPTVVLEPVFAES